MNAAAAEAGSLLRTLRGRSVDGRFLVREVLGGARSSVFLADDRVTGERVALKVVTPSDDPRPLRRLRAEIEALAALDHPRVVRLIAHGVLQEGGHYAAVAHVEGTSLDRWLRERDPDLDAMLRVAGDLCEALEHVHAAGLVHRDIKARNVLITEQPLTATLIDFDAARLPHTDPVAGDGAIVGSVHTMSPEQIRKGDIDHRADLYSLGVLLFRMSAGRYPFHGANSDAVLAAHLHTVAPSLAAARADRPTPPALDALVGSLLAKDPAARPPNAAAVQRALADCRGETRPPRGSTALAAALLVLVLAALAGWLLS